MLRPDGAEVEAPQRLDPLVEVGEAAEPDEPIRIMLVEVDPTDPDSHLLLPLDEVVFEDMHERVPRPGVERVLTKLDHLGSREREIACVDTVVYADVQAAMAQQLERRTIADTLDTILSGGTSFPSARDLTTTS
jgi:hypothetical protein